MNRRFILSTLAILASLSLAAQGLRDSVLHIKAVSITASRKFIKEEAGTRQTEIDSAVFRSKVNTSLSELLSENTSIFIKSHGRGALATASFRGTAPSHTRVSWNGIPVNSPMTGMVDFSLLPVYLIDNLKLKHGAASISEGSGGIGGAMQLGSTVNWSSPWSLRYVQGIGSYGTWNEFIDFGMGGKRLRSRTRIYHMQSENDFTFVNRGIANIDPLSGELVNPLDTNKLADYRLFGLMQEFYYRPGGNQLATLRYWGQSSKRTIPRPTSYEGPDNSNLNRSEDLDHRLVARWQYYGHKTRILVSSAYSGKSLHFLQLNRVPGMGTIPAVNSASREHGFYNQLKANRDLDSTFSIEFSARFNHHCVDSRDSVKAYGYDAVQNRMSVFLAMRKSLAGKINLNLMLRQEWVEGERVPFIPFLGVDYRPFASGRLILKGSMARNYRHPTLNELYWQPGGNPDLKPEEGFSLEAGAEYSWKGESTRISSELSIYRSFIDRWIIWIPSYSGLWEPMNMKKVLSTGLEYYSRIGGDLGKWRYDFSGSYAFTRSVNVGDPLVWGDESTGKQLPYIPVHSGNLMADLSYGLWSLTYQYNAYGERFTTSSNDRGSWTPFYPYFMNDVSLGRSFHFKSLSLQAEFKVENLFNETYYSILYRPMPGRNYLITLIIDLKG